MRLSDVTRRRIAALLLVAGIVIGVLALQDVGPFSNPPTAEEKAQAAVEDFFDAAHHKDFKSMCGLLTPAYQTQITQETAARLASVADVSTCAQALEAQDKVLRTQLGDSLGQTRIVKVDDSRVSGNRAAVDAVLTFPGAKRTEPRTFELELIRDEWRISGSIL
jgi:hypothetical protein